MRVDIVACYYDQAHCADRFWWGIAENAHHIGKVYIVKDGPWAADEVRRIEDAGRAYGLSAVYLSHDKRIHGVGESLNMGIAASLADYCFTMSFKQILAPRCLERITARAEPETLVIGHVDTIPADTPASQLPYVEPLVHDRIIAAWGSCQARNRPWLCAHNGHTLIPRLSHLALGGFNEEFGKIGYGLEDLEYGARWCHRYGLDRIKVASSVTWQPGTAKPGSSCPEKYPQEEAFVLLAETLSTLYEKRWALFVNRENRGPDSHVCVGHGEDVERGGADVVLNCATPWWMPHGALEIQTVLPNPWIYSEAAHLRWLVKKLAPEGSIVIRGTPSIPLITELSAELGLVADVYGDVVELTRE